MDINPVNTKAVSELDAGTLFYASIASPNPLLCMSVLVKGQSGDRRIVVPFVFPGDETSAFTTLEETAFSDPVVILKDAKAVVDEGTLTNSAYYGQTRSMIFSDGSGLFVHIFFRGLRGGLLDLKTGLVQNNMIPALVSFSKWRIERGDDDPETIVEYDTDQISQ